MVTAKRQRLDLHLDGDGGRGHPHLPPEGRPGYHLRAAQGRAGELACAAPTVLISLANAAAAVRGEVPADVHVVAAGAPPTAATIERLEGEFGWEVTQVYGLTETAPFITVCAPLPEHEDMPPADRAHIKARQGVELLTSGELRVVDTEGREVPADGRTVGEIVVRGNVVMEGYYHDPEEDIIGFARERLAHFKAPRGVTFVSELPKTATGKIQKFVLRKGAPNLAAQ